MKLRCAVSQRLGLKGMEIARNVVKVGVHAFLSNGHPNLWSNFNSMKLVKIETPSCGFSRVGFKGVQNRSNHCESWRSCLFIQWASKSMIKFQFREIGQKWNHFMHCCYGWVWKGSKLLQTWRKLWCMLVCQIFIKIYDQILILRNWSKWNFVM